MRLWRNRQTRTFEGRMGNHPGSSPGNRTKAKNEPKRLVFRFGAVTGGDDEVKFDLVISVKFALSASEIPLRGVKCLRGAQT